MALQILTSAPSVCRNMIGARHFDDADALRAHYAAVHARLWSVRAPEPARSAITVIPVTPPDEEREGTTPGLDYEASSGPSLFPRDIIGRVAAEYGLTLEEVRGVRRTKSSVAARRAAIAALLDAYPNASLAALGRWMHKHHATVLHTLRALGRTTAGGSRWGRELPPEMSAEEPEAAALATPRSVIADIARRHCVLIREISGPSTTMPVVRARHEAMIAVADAFPTMRSADITALFGREQSSLRHARKALARRRPAPLAVPSQEPQP